MTTEYVIERWKPAMTYLLMKQAERERKADRMMWFATGFMAAVVGYTVGFMVAAI